jgi:hypothetical protein
MSNQLELLTQNKPTLAQLVLVNMPVGTTTEEAQRVALKEISNFEMMAEMKPDLKGCTPLSVLLAVKQVICDNLTLAPSAGLVYLVPGRVGNDWVVNYDPTANGRLSMAYQSGTILDNKRPTFTSDGNGKLTSVTVEFLVPSYPEPRWEVITFNEVHFKKWMDASARKNKGAPNPNYLSWNGGIDPEFAGTKAIRHGLNKRGANMNAHRNIQISAPKFQPTASAIKEAQDEHGHTEAVVVSSIINNEVKPEDLA